ncbi:unnamed protein product [Urochloa humidicola]
MDAGLLSAFMNNLVTRLFTLLEEKYKLNHNFKDDVTFLKDELPYIISTIQLWQDGIDEPPLLHLPVDDLRQVAQDMEDCIDRIMFRQSRKEQGESDETRKTNKNELIKEMQRLKKVIEDAHKRNARYTVHEPGLSAGLSTTQGTDGFSTDRHVPRKDMIGVDRPLEELMNQLEEAETDQLKVISIVGLCGSGKTLLAQELYESDVGKQFKIRAWVSAGNMEPSTLIMKIIEQVQEAAEPPVSSNARELSSALFNHLKNERYFIVIDDVSSAKQWDDIESAFPTDFNFGSRIVVTTQIRSVANTCSCPNGYVHEMRKLGEKHSKQLFLKEASMEEYLTSPHSDSKAILNICDGQPIALSSLGKFMKKRSQLTGPDWDGFCNQVRCQLNSDQFLKIMHQALIHVYTSLPNHAVKACLLYFAMFPSDHRVRSKSLMRRWLAEGFVQNTKSLSHTATQNFEELLDRNIVQPIDVSNNMMVRTCKTYGMMHLFITLKSQSENFIALFDDGNCETKNVRRLSIRDNNIADDSSLNIDLSLVRTLIVFGKAGKAILDFDKYQLLKVLDLEECSDLQDDHLDKVCALLLLKYLSLGSNVTTIPKKIKKLKVLETLDLRRTAVEILPIEVLQLPKLFHLFGMFKLPDVDVQNREHQKFLSSLNYKLQTLAGFIFDDSKGFVELMSHMKKLKKVEIWCDSSISSISLTSNLQKAIQEFIHDEKGANNDPRSLSVHFNGCSEELLKGLKDNCNLNSLKLQGKLEELPGFVTTLRRLRELCLQTTKLTAVLLVALGDLKDLQYLKLIADELDESVLKNEALPALLRLCFVLKVQNFQQSKTALCQNSNPFNYTVMD